jgi:hypothetical protein
MAVVGVMRCPANHAANDSAEEVAFIREWAAATSWDSTRESLLAEGHCPACPGTERLQSGTAVLVGRQHSTGRCPVLRGGVDHRRQARLDVPRHRKADLHARNLITPPIGGRPALALGMTSGGAGTIGPIERRGRSAF